jgi:tetratricopeptide (TPR) repeat protein
VKRLAWLAVVLLGGCVYYNGMYRAEHLASDAEKAEKEGRTIQAQNLWGQVGVKADTVLSRHPDSKWADDALYLSAKSRERLGDCTRAVDALQRLLAVSPDQELRELATFLLGTCWQKMGNTRQASEAFAQLVGSSDSGRRDEALFQHGRSLRLGGRYAEALEMLAETHHAAAGDIEQAMKLLDKSITEDHHDGTIYLKVDPRFDNLRANPQFQQFLKRLKLAD